MKFASLQLALGTLGQGKTTLGHGRGAGRLCPSEGRQKSKREHKNVAWSPAEWSGCGTGCGVPYPGEERKDFVHQCLHVIPVK